MTRDELNIALAAILTTAAETEPAPFPQTMAYLALGSDLAKWEMVKSILGQGGLATLGSDCITLTAKGREIAGRCQSVAKTA